MTSPKNYLSVWKFLFIINIVFSISIAYGDVTIPDVIGLALDDAKAIIQENGLVVGNITEQKTHHPSGSVLVQAPKAQQSVPENTAIRLVVAIPRDKPKTTTTPDLYGLSLEAATAAIQGAKLTLGNVQKRKKEIEEAIVLYQSPPANSQLINNSKVNIIISDPVPLTGPRIKLHIDKKQAAIGENVRFTSTVLNPPAGETPSFSFTIDRKAYNTDIAEFSHVFTQAGKHNVIASVRYGRQPWIASLTQAIHIGSQTIESIKTTQSMPDSKSSSISNTQDNTSSDNKPSVMATDATQKPNVETPKIRLITEKKRFSVGESTLLSIDMDESIPRDQLRYAFTVNGKAHYTDEPEYKLLLSKPTQYIVSASVRHKRDPWIASDSLLINVGFQHSKQSDKSRLKDKTIQGVRVKAVLDKDTYSIGDTVTLIADACNVPDNKNTRYSLTIDQKVYYSEKPKFKHTFTRAGTYTITTSVRHGRQPWIPSSSKIVTILPKGAKQVSRTSKPSKQSTEPYQTVPHVVGLDTKEALKILRKNKLKGVLTDKNKTGKVLSQKPVAESCIPTGGRINLLSSTKKLPNKNTTTKTTADINQDKTTTAEAETKQTPSQSESKQAKQGQTSPTVSSQTASNQAQKSLVTQSKNSAETQLASTSNPSETSVATEKTPQEQTTIDPPQKDTSSESVFTAETRSQEISILQDILSASTTQSPPVTTDQQNYVEALLNEADNYQSTDDEEKIAELATSYYKNASIYRLASQTVTDNELAQSPTEYDASDATAEQLVANDKTPLVNSVYLSASDSIVFTGSDVDFTVTQAINNTNSKYSLVFHDEGIVSPVTQSKVSHAFSSWGIHSVYVEAETTTGIVKSRMIRVWVFPKWLAISLAFIAALLLFLIFMAKKDISFSLPNMK